MKKNRIYFGLLMLMLVIVIIAAAYGMSDAGKEETVYTVSVIVDDSNNDRWNAMREGLEQAARDNNIRLNYVFSGKFSSVDEELDLIQREIKDGADGIIVQMISSHIEMEALNEFSMQAAVALIETDMEPQGLYAVTGPDNVEMGKALGGEIIQGLGDDVKEKKVGILCGNQEQIAMQERLAGVREVLAAKEAQILWTLQGRNELIAEALLESDRNNPVDIIIALGNEETELAVDYLLGKGEEKSCLLYGVGCSEKAVYYLDKGRIQSLVVPNEFNMGYLSMEQMAGQLISRLSEMKSRNIDYLVIDQTNLYEEENQKILFPIVQ